MLRKPMSNYQDIMRCRMNYNEYCEKMQNVPVADNLEFRRAVIWTHPELLPLKVMGFRDTSSAGEVIKLPEAAVNTFGRNVLVIAFSDDLFRNRTDITDIILPHYIGRIPAAAFSGCSGLRCITIPKNITLIKPCTFDGCVSLSDIYYEGTASEWEKVEKNVFRRETDFGNLIPGTPVQQIMGERDVHIPGNDALLTANIHYRCDLRKLYLKSGKQNTSIR